MSIDLNRTRDPAMRLQRSIASTSLPINEWEEGMLVCGVLEGGVEKASVVAAPVGTEKVIGYCWLAESPYSFTSNVEEITVPAGPAPLSVDLRFGRVLPGKLRAVDKDTSAALVVVVSPAVPAAGQVSVNYSTGALVFNAAEALHKVELTYHYELSVSQARTKFGERHINNFKLHADFDDVSLGTGLVELWSDQYDSAVDFSTGVLRLGEKGTITVGGAGPVLNQASVISLPSVTSPRLGVRLNLG